jgi:gamma-glutamyltranspeptidase/glutathione hydrolase
MLFKKSIVVSLTLIQLGLATTHAQQTQKPPLHGKEWMAITGKPLAATAEPLFSTKVGMQLMQLVLCWLQRAPCGMY